MTDEHPDVPQRRPRGRRAAPKRAPGAALVGRALALAARWARGHRQVVVIAGAGLVAVVMLGGAVAVIGSSAGQIDEAAPVVEAPRPTPSVPPTGRAYPPILPTATPPAEPAPTSGPDDGADEPVDGMPLEPTVDPEPTETAETPEPAPEPPPVSDDDHPGRGHGPKKPKG